MKYGYTVDFQLISDGGVIGYGDLSFTSSKKLSVDGLKQIRKQILENANQNKKGGFFTRQDPVGSVSILNIWETVE